MPSGFQNWSVTAASNATADSAINFAEGQAPSSINDSTRAVMAVLAKWRDDNNGSLTTGGTSVAYTLTTNTVFTSLALLANQTLSFTMSVTSGATPTLNVDGLGAKPIVSASGTAIPVGALIANSVYVVIYNNSSTEFRLHAVHGVIVPLQNYLTGLALSTAGSSATFGIATGTAADSTNVSMLTLASAFTKTTSAWALGTGNGSLDTGAIGANTWYHVHLIKRIDTGVVDVLVSTSASAPTMPTSYTLFRRIGSMRTDGSSQWRLFHQLGDEFLWDVSGSGSTTNPGTSAALYTVLCPNGVQTLAILGVISQVIGTVDGRGVLSSPDASDQTPGATNFNFGGISTAATGTLDWVCQATVRTDTSSRVRGRLAGSDANTVFALTTIGYIDSRGKS